MSAPVPQQGSETRQQILPAGVPSSMGFFGSSYNPTDDLPAPPDIGARAGDNLSDVVNAVKGVAYYTDMIGFGDSTSSFTQGMGVRPLGVNYFLPTGQTCSNGAEMQQYINGIPTGTALGQRVAESMSRMGLPPLKGLAPGIIEDAEGALNPLPLMGAVFGSGYPVCQRVELPVGNSQGKTGPTGDANDTTWIATKPNKITRRDGKAFQTAWVQATDSNGNPITIDRDAWEKTPKTYNFDGTLTATAKNSREGFESYGGKQILPYLVIGGVLLVAFALMPRARSLVRH